MRKHQVFDPSYAVYGYYILSRVCKPEDCGLTHVTQFDEKIGRILGFDPGMTGYTEPSNNVKPSSVTLVNTKQRSDFSTVQITHRVGDQHVTGNRPVYLARSIPEQLFVYSDVCEPYTVGDTQAPLLRIVSLDNANYKFGGTVVKHFAPIKYIPLMKNNFHNITIDIRDALGKSIAFEYGTLTVALHFKRVL